MSPGSKSGRKGELLLRLGWLGLLGVELVPRGALPRDNPEEAMARVAEEVRACRKCPLWETRTSAVPGEGSPRPDLVVVGEGPGREEDLQGRPFVGDAGQMLDRMLLNVLGLKRGEVHILNVVKCRPPGNRDPKPQEIEACLPYLKRQIQILSPRLILALGTVAAKTLVGTREGVMRLRGRLFSFQSITLIPTFHPAFLLRTPERKKEAFEDLKLAKRILEGVG